MKLKVLVVALVACAISPAFADKPESAEKGKPTMEQNEAYKGAMKVKEDKLKGIEKQKEMKSEQEQKELNKGSEKGQEARENRKKWWKFWE